MRKAAVAASNNKDHPTRSFSSSPLASTNQLFTSIIRGHSPIHSIGTLLLLVRATYIWVWVLFFAHIPFVVNHIFSATPTERLQQYKTDQLPVVDLDLET